MCPEKIQVVRKVWCHHCGLCQYEKESCSRCGAKLPCLPKETVREVQVGIGKTTIHRWIKEMGIGNS